MATKKKAAKKKAAPKKSTAPRTLSYWQMRGLKKRERKGAE